MISVYKNSVPNFICTYFRFMSDIVRMVNKDGENYLTQEQIEPLLKRDEVPLTSLLKLKILREVDGVYEIDKRVAAFIAFSNNEYALSSPESVRKFHASIQMLRDKLMRATEANDIVRYTDQLIAELRDFSDTLDESITRLLQETLLLKQNTSKQSPKERFDRASEIIREYVEPLNEMVEDRPNTLLPLVREIASVALQKSDTFDRNIETIARRLKMQADSVHKNTELFGRKIIGELFTLKKIQRSSSVLRGAIAWLEHGDKLEQRGIAGRYNTRVHSEEFYLEAVDIFDEMIKSDEVIDMPTDTEIKQAFKGKSYFLFDKFYFMDIAREALPINNVFKWLYEEMRKKGELNYENYCDALVLLDEMNVKYSYHRDILDFDTFNLSIPIAKVDELRKESE